MQSFQLAMPLCRHVLEKFYVGGLRHSTAEGVDIVRYEGHSAEEEFYSTLKRRVEKFFRGNEVCGHIFCAACLTLRVTYRGYASLPNSG